MFYAYLPAVIFFEQQQISDEKPTEAEEDGYRKDTKLIKQAIPRKPEGLQTDAGVHNNNRQSCNAAETI